MILSSKDKVTDTDQPQISLEVEDRWGRNVAQGDYVTVEKVLVGETDVYHRVAQYGDVTWEDEDLDKLDGSDLGMKLELALEAAYREKHFEGTK